MKKRINQEWTRLEKLDRIRELGINPYPHKYVKSHSSKQLKDKKKELNGSEIEVSLAGRIVRYNRKGKLCFLHLKDQQGRIQVMIGRNGKYPGDYELIKLLGLGDWIGVKGTMFTTRTGEYSLKAEKVELLSKAMRSLPVPKERKEADGQVTVFVPFSDKQLRYRQRYLDLALNDRVREVFICRSKIIQSIREYLLERNFLEVETPILQPLYGGPMPVPLPLFIMQPAWSYS